LVKRIVITGIGIISPLGFGREAFWKSMLAGQSAIAPIQGIDVSNYGAKLGGELKDFKAEDFLGKKGLRYLNWGTKMLTSAVKLAFDDAKLEANDALGDKTGIVIGSALANYPQTTNYTQMAMQRGPEDLMPMESYDVALNASINFVSVWFKMKPFARTIASGFTSSLDAIADAAELLRQGAADIVVAGGVEQLSIDAYLLFYWQNMLSGQKPNSEPSDEFNHPFGKGRNGFVLSEGSYVVILEELESARQRGATIYAEVSGHGSLYIGSRNFTNEQKIDKSARTMLGALELSDLNPADLGFVCASANSSDQMDALEARALRANGIKAPVTAPKSVTGESYGASGAMQVAVSALALKDQSIPATIGDYQIDPALDVDLIRAQAKPNADSVLVNSLDPHGNCSCLVLRGLV